VTLLYRGLGCALAAVLYLVNRMEVTLSRSKRYVSPEVPHCDVAISWTSLLRLLTSTVDEVRLERIGSSIPEVHVGAYVICHVSLSTPCGPLLARLRLTPQAHSSREYSTTICLLNIHSLS
jgi:hypothetical protein